MCGISSKLRIMTMENVIDVINLSLFLTLNRFHKCLWCFYWWLGTSKYRLVLCTVQVSSVQKPVVEEDFIENGLFGHSKRAKLKRWTKRSVDNIMKFHFTLSWRRFLSYGNQSIDLLCKSMDWFLYHRFLLHERVNPFMHNAEKLPNVL